MIEKRRRCSLVPPDSRGAAHSMPVEESDPVGAFGEPGDLSSAADLSMVSGSSSGEASVRDPQPIPAWRRIEEYREMRELNMRLRDEVYGGHPLSSLWDEEGF